MPIKQRFPTFIFISKKTKYILLILFCILLFFPIKNYIIIQLRNACIKNNFDASCSDKKIWACHYAWNDYHCHSANELMENSWSKNCFITYKNEINATSFYVFSYIDNCPMHVH